MRSDDEHPVQTVDFDQSYENRLESATLERLWSSAYADDYPAAVRPNGFYSLSTLQRIVAELKLDRGQTLADLGCGHGGAGLWMAQRFGINLIGIDLSLEGIMLATRRAAEFGVQERSRFKVGDMTETGLPDRSCDAAISLDVLVFVEDKATAFRETARILRPGGRFAFTSWEQTGYSARLKTVQLDDYRQVLEACGFSVEVYEEPRRWRVQQQTLLENAITHEATLQCEMGRDAAAMFVGMARGALRELPRRRYVLGVCTRRWV